MKTRRNDPCTCGSGKKYKRCCAGKPIALSAGQPAPGLPVALETEVPVRVRQRRRCAGCTACCGPALTLNEPRLVTPQGESCPNLRPNGCAIYGEAMPATCKGYLCNYLLEPGSLTVNERPDRVGAIVRLAPDRSTYVNECAPGGLMNVLGNRFWRPVIRRNLLSGNPILLSWLDDPHNREIVKLRFRDGRLGCELTSCHADGREILETREPVYERPIRFALVIPHQDFAFDPDALVAQLRDREFTVIHTSQTAKTATNLRFLFTRRQADVIQALRALIEQKATVPITAEGERRSRVKCCAPAVTRRSEVHP